MPDDLDLLGARRAQLTCAGCGARFAAARSTCVHCLQPPQAGCGCAHDMKADVLQPPPRRRPGAYCGKATKAPEGPTLPEGGHGESILRARNDDASRAAGAGGRQALLPQLLDQVKKG